MRTISVLSSLLLVANSLTAQIDPGSLRAMRARSVGPAGMSGRIASIAVASHDPNVIYVGAATGGVWKSANGGVTWDPIFDDQPTASIGAIAVFRRNPDIVWVGTGEGNPRNSAGVGRGIFKSVDAGRTWRHIGLERSERIHRVVLHPTDPDVAYAAVLGPSWSDGQERGVFKTADGGDTWTRILYVDERTGASDLVMDAVNPDKLFAGMWTHRRWPWFFESGGAGSGLYVTYDGGEHWRRYTEADGMPAGNLGRIGLTAAVNDPDVVYAIVEAEQSALLRSNDGGDSWRTIDAGPGVAPRPFYYADIHVDPTNENRIYNLHSQITVSEDQGKTFRTVVPSQIIHGDVQDLWIDPTDGRRLIMANDGGLGISYDRGETWRFVENLPLAQFYHISVDMDTPFNVYGGLQDNGSWFGPSHSWYDGPIRNYYWTRIGSGDGFASFTNFADTRYAFGMSQGGEIRRIDKITGERKDIVPTDPGGTRLRFNWNAALNVDPFDSTVIYLGSQFVHRSDNAGTSWTIISPDLTTNDPAKQRWNESGGITRDGSGAETHTTIITIAPSAVERGVLWVGTDDGNVQLTRDGGASWTDLTDRLDDVPEGSWIAHIEPSRFDGAAAFVAVDDHRRGNWTTYLYETTNYGRTWRSIATGDLDGFVHVIEQDPVEPGLLFAGTEFGLFVSLNAGGRWFKWTHGLPTVPVRDVIVHPADHDLVIATHGRAAYVLDDIRPLRALAADPSVLQRPVHLFDAPSAVQHTVAESMTAGYRSSGHTMFAGENRPYGAMLTYGVSADDGDDGDEADEADEGIDVEILDAAGTVIRTMHGPRRGGLNRVTWDLRRDGFLEPNDSGDRGDGPEVLPGSYQARIAIGDVATTTDITVLAEPRTTIAPRDRRANFDAIVRVGGQMELAATVMSRLRELRDANRTIQGLLEARGDAAPDLVHQATALSDTLSAVADRIVQQRGSSTPGIGGSLDALYGSLQSSWDAPTEAQRLRLETIERDLAEAVAAFNAALAGPVADFRRAARNAGLDILPQVQPVSR